MRERAATWRGAFGVLLSGLLALALSGCGSAPSAVEVPPRERPPLPTRRPAADPRHFVPDDTTAVIRLDVAAARRSPRYETLAGWIRELQPIGRDAEAHLLGVLERTEALYLTVDAYRDHTQLRCAILSGDYVEGQVEEAVRRLINPMVEASSFRERRGGHRAIVFGANVLVTVDDDNTWVFCPSRSIDAVLARHGPPALLSDPAFLTLAEAMAFEEGTVRMVGVGAPGTRDFERDLRRFVDAHAAHVRGYGLAFDLGATLTMRLSVFTDDAPTAHAVADFTRDALRDARAHPLAAMSQLGATLREARVREREGEARLDLALDEAATDALMARLGGLVLLSVQAQGSAE